jgi:hypothetical protein
MKRIPYFWFLVWILLSIVLFVYVLPIPTDILIKIIAGYIFYLLVKEIFYQHFEHGAEIGHRVGVLHERIEHSPHKETVYVDERLEEEHKKKEKEKKENMGEYV